MSTNSTPHQTSSVDVAWPDDVVQMLLRVIAPTTPHEHSVDVAWPDDAVKLLLSIIAPPTDPASATAHPNAGVDTTNCFLQRANTAPCPLNANCPVQLPEAEHRGLQKHFEQYHASWWQDVVHKFGRGPCPVPGCSMVWGKGWREEDRKKVVYHVAMHVYAHGKAKTACLVPGCTRDFGCTLVRESHLRTEHGLASELLSYDQGWVYWVSRSSR